MKYLTTLKPMLSVLIIISMFSCSPSAENQLPEKTNVSVTLKASNSRYEAVNVEINDVLLKVIDDDSEPKCWLSLNAQNTGSYNLSNLASGESIMLVNNKKIAKGQVFQIWLDLGDKNSVVIEGKEYALSMPRFHQAGLMVEASQYLKAGTNYTFNLEFEVDESIVETDVEGYIVLKPVLRASIN